MNTEMYFTKLENLYKKLDECLLPAVKNCGKCCICCLNLKETVFSFLEAEYINKRTGVIFGDNIGESLKKIRENHICLFCNLTDGKCSIYPFRPFRCRLYGPFAEETTSYLFKNCVYSSGAVIYPPEDKNSLPFFKEFHLLCRDYVNNINPEEKDELDKVINSLPEEKERAKNSIPVFKDALEISFHRAPLLSLTGRAYATMKDYNKAYFYYEEAIKEDPLYDFTYYLRGLNYYEERKFKEAEEELKKAGAINPENINIPSFLIMLYITLHKYNEARMEIKSLSVKYPFILRRYPFLKDLGFL